MANTRYSSQRVNTELLQRGIPTFGSYERRLSRLQRFMAYENRSKKAVDILSRIVHEKTTTLRAHTRAFVKKLEAARTLIQMHYGKMETIQSVNIQTMPE